MSIRRGTRYGGSSRGSRPARPLDWVCAQFDVTAGNGISCAWLMDPLEVLETFTDPTLMATRTFLSVRNSGTQGVDGGFAAFGIIAWDGISAAPPTDCPGPLSDCDFDWINRIVAPVVAGATVGFMNPNIFDNTHLSKARRRLPSQTGLLVVFEGEGLTNNQNYGADVRCLIKE